MVKNIKFKCAEFFYLAEFFRKPAGKSSWDLATVEPEPHHFGGTGAGALKRCGSGSDGSKPNVLYSWIIKNVTK
jgi:hypothetical protein